jgi:osmotically-inducible protein OsmY
VVKGVKGVREIQNDVVIHCKTQRPDLEIKREIEERLKNNVWVDDGLIKVQVDDGEVALGGTAGSLAEKRRAYSLSWLSGVRQVRDEDLKVEWWARDRMRKESKYTIKNDKEIEEAVNDALLYDPRIFSFDVEPNVDNGVVTLTGTVNNLQAKRAAESDARNTVGVLRVVNRLKVRPVEMVPDEEITAAVRDALLVDPIVERYEIDVSVVNGKVYLSGMIDSKYEKRRAEETVARQLGVVEVQNNLLTEYLWEPKSDWAIREDIETKFRWNPFIDPNDITVTVVDGYVTLTGQVDMFLESKLAVENAFEGGARTVDNDLEVRFDYGLPQPGYHYEAPYWPDPWLHGGMGLYWQKQKGG